MRWQWVAPRVCRASSAQAPTAGRAQTRASTGPRGRGCRRSRLPGAALVELTPTRIPAGQCATRADDEHPERYGRIIERPLMATLRCDRFWTFAPIDETRLNGRGQSPAGQLASANDNEWPSGNGRTLAAGSFERPKPGLPQFRNGVPPTSELSRHRQSSRARERPRGCAANAVRTNVG